MKYSKSDLIIFAIVIVFIFFSGRFDQTIRLIITGLLILVIFIYQTLASKKRDKKEGKK